MTRDQIWVIRAVVAIALVGGTILMWLILRPDPSCSDPKRAERIEKQALQLIPQEVILSEENMNDCDSGGSVFQDVVLKPGTDMPSLIGRLDGRHLDSDWFHSSTVERDVDGTRVRFDFSQIVGELRLELNLS